MLEKSVSANGVAIYVSPLLRDIGVPHAFSTRIGGVSGGPFDSLNLGNPNGCAIQDNTDHIRENYRRLQAAAGCGSRQRAWLHQVHGPAVVRIGRGASHHNDSKADALVTDDDSRVLSVRIADCVPVLLSSDNGRIVSAVHAGWRGVVAGVVVKALREVCGDKGVSASRVTAAIGPSIGAEAFEVGPEVLEEFVRIFGPRAPIWVREDGKGTVDLRRVIRRQLIDAGVSADRIDETDRCTFRDAQEFFSHRRDNGVTGRMAAIIAPVG